MFVVSLSYACRNVCRKFVDNIFIVIICRKFVDNIFIIIICRKFVDNIFVVIICRKFVDNICRMVVIYLLIIYLSYAYCMLDE